MSCLKPHLVECELTNEGPVRGRRGAATRRAGRRSVTVNLSESPLAWLYARGHLDERLFLAGERLRGDFERAQIAPSVTMWWDPMRVDGGGAAPLNPTERQISAKRRFDGALTAAGRNLADILWRVVCAGETLPCAEKALDWPARSGKLVLGIALDRVAEFYRID